MTERSETSPVVSCCCCCCSPRAMEFPLSAFSSFQHSNEIYCFVFAHFFLTLDFAAWFFLFAWLMLWEIVQHYKSSFSRHIQRRKKDRKGSTHVAFKSYASKKFQIFHLLSCPSIQFALNQIVQDESNLKSGLRWISSLISSRRQSIYLANWNRNPSNENLLKHWD